MLRRELSGEVAGNAAAYEVLIERLEVVEDATKVVHDHLDREAVLVMCRSQHGRNMTRCFEIATAFDADGEGVECLDMSACHRRDHTGIQSAREENANGNVAHEPFHHRPLQRV